MLLIFDERAAWLSRVPLHSGAGAERDHPLYKGADMELHGFDVF